jgi:phenylacetate-CoA ligase
MYDFLTGRSVIEALDRFLDRQAWDPARLSEDGRCRLEDLLGWAADRVPFYASMHGNASDTPLSRFPLLTKSDLRVAGDRLFAGGARPERAERTTSGGSTGEPVAVYLDRKTCDAHAAAVLRHQAWMGLDLVCAHALLWGPPPGVVTYGTWQGRLKGWAIRRRFLPTYGLTDEGAAAIRENLRHKPVEQVIGYSSALDHVAAGAPPLERPVRAVVASAELLYPAQRRRIQQFFGAPVFERYGCNEFAALAHDCGEGRLHVNADRVHLEVLREDGRAAAEGEIGEAVVTDLDNRAMPLIRYRMGDAVEAGGGCRCALPFPTIAALHGRTSDLLAGAEGRPISPRLVSQALEPCGTVLEHQVRVEGGRPRRVEVRALGEFDRSSAERAVERLFGHPVPVGLVERCERWPSGKVRPVLRDTEKR